MKAARLHELEGPEGLHYEDVPDPQPGSGEIVVKLHNAALNRRDVFVTQGMYPGVTPDILPGIPGSDGSGEVYAKGDGADGPDEGTEVVINPALYWGDEPRTPGKEYRILGLPDDGTFAQFVKVPAENVFPKPSHLSHEEAAAIPLGALTGYRALVTRGVRRRPVTGTVHALPFSVVGDDPEELGLRVLTAALGSFGPNTIVIDIDTDSGTLYAHQLVSSDPAAAAMPLGGA